MTMSAIGNNALNLFNQAREVILEPVVIETEKNFGAHCISVVNTVSEFFAEQPILGLGVLVLSNFVVLETAKLIATCVNKLIFHRKSCEEVKPGSIKDVIEKAIVVTMTAVPLVGLNIGLSYILPFSVEFIALVVAGVVVLDFIIVTFANQSSVTVEARRIDRTEEVVTQPVLNNNPVDGEDQTDTESDTDSKLSSPKPTVVTQDVVEEIVVQPANQPVEIAV